MTTGTHARRALALAGWLALGLAAPGAHAQEANLSEAATQPPKGRITFREQVRFTRYELDDRDIDRLVLNTRLTLGLTGALAAVADIPAVRERDRSDSAANAAGLGDISLGLKWRFWQHDTGPIETRRLAALGGVRLPTGSGDLSTDGVDPFLGLVFTMVEGRHGVNAAARYQFATDGLENPVSAGMGRDDLLTIETSYLYRLSPAAYTSDTAGSFYAVIESFVDYETNGDTEWRLAPGLLWEARRWAAEASVILPAARDIDHRAETKWGLALGVRVLF
ncbi:MAG: transporter [Phycisphaerales bacterium]|nr:transporter [Planctomycetota bacterium]MCH8509315.1 transporter [Phycisphaerales bacterium]